MEHGGGLAAQENKWGWNQHQTLHPPAEHLGEACSEQAKDKKQSPGLELTQKEEEGGNVMIMLLLRHTPSHREVAEGMAYCQ